MNNKPSPNNNRDLVRYASLGTQILAGLGIAVFIGLKADGWLHTMPLFSCVLPLLVLVGIFYRLIRETSNKNRDEKK
ncbi:MAG TPA: AtpZ/AtpI family protein [Chitinophagaceae bacterium]